MTIGRSSRFSPLIRPKLQVLSRTDAQVDTLMAVRSQGQCYVLAAIHSSSYYANTSTVFLTASVLNNRIEAIAIVYDCITGMQTRPHQTFLRKY